MKYYEKYTEDRICEHCGVVFKAYIYNVKRGWGHYCSTSCSKKGNKNRTGQTFTKDQRERISKTLKGQYSSGKLVSPFAKMPVLYGKDAPNWRGGATVKASRARMSFEYKKWRYAVLKRDRHRCVVCGVNDGKLQADHVKSFSKFPELRFDVSNGRTLCIPCHRETANYGAKASTRL